MEFLQDTRCSSEYFAWVVRGQQPSEIIQLYPKICRITKILSNFPKVLQVGGKICLNPGSTVPEVSFSTIT